MERNVNKRIFVCSLILFVLIMQSASGAFSFVGKRVLVTGSSGGIGAGIARALAKEGARIIVHYHVRHEGAKLTKQAIVDDGGVCDGIVQCDFTKKENISDLFKAVDDIWDRKIDVLVNNAGLITKVAVEDDDDDCSAWMDTIQVNLNAPYQLSKLAHQRMKCQEQGGIIVNVGSIHGGISVEWMTAYAASKAGLHRLTAGLANEWAPDNVKVCAIAPGIVEVERTSVVLSTEEAQNLWFPHIPANKYGTVEDCANAVKFLIQNDFTTGSILTLDGGSSSRANMPVRPRPPKPGKHADSSNGL